MCHGGDCGGRARRGHISYPDEIPGDQDVIRSVHSVAVSQTYKATLKVNGRPLQMEIDTGAAVSHF